MIKMKCQLTWHNYSHHIRNMMDNMLQSTEHSDVTLICEDKKEIRAHKNILSASSEFFKEILQLDKNPVTMIYLKGIQFTEMEPILRFIYLGEATVYKETINVLLSVAKSLDIKDLSENNEDDEQQIEETGSNIQPKTESDDLDSLNGTSKDQTRISGKVTGLICGNIQEDELLSFDCVHCDYKAKKKDYLMSHFKTVHEKVKYNCDKCDKQFTQKCHLKSHYLVVHEGIRYPCKLCDFVTKFKPALKHHIQALHDGIKFHCQHCEYKSGYKSKLREHMNQEHPILMESMDKKI